MAEKHNLNFLKDNLNLKTLRLLLGLRYDGQYDAPDLLKVLKDMTGELTSAVMLQQIIQWDARMRDRRDGWWWKSKKSWLDQAGLSRHQIDRAELRIKACGVMRKLDLPIASDGKAAWPSMVKHYRLHAFRFWRMFARALDITWERLVSLVEEIMQKQAENDTNTTSRKPAEHPDEKQQDILPESGNTSCREESAYPSAESQDSNRTTSVLSTEESSSEKQLLPAPIENDSPMQEKLHLVEPVVVVVENPSQKNWGDALQQLEIQLDRGNFDTWLRDAKLIACETPPPSSATPPSPPVYVIGVKNEFAVEACQQRLYRTIRRITSDIHGSPVELRFEVTDPDPPKLTEHPALKVLLAADNPPAVPVELPKPADVEQLYIQYFGSVHEKDTPAFALWANRFSLPTIDFALQTTQFKHSRGMVDDPVSYTWGILQRA